MHFDDLPQSESYRRIPFDNAEVAGKDGAKSIDAIGADRTERFDV